MLKCRLACQNTIIIIVHYFGIDILIGYINSANTNLPISFECISNSIKLMFNDSNKLSTNQCYKIICLESPTDHLDFHCLNLETRKRYLRQSRYSKNCGAMAPLYKTQCQLFLMTNLVIKCWEQVTTQKKKVPKFGSQLQE